VKFRNSLYAFFKQYGTEERRINAEIVQKSGKKAYQIKDYIESTLAEIPGEHYSGNKVNQRLHKKALDAFTKMQAAAQKDGVPLIIVHGYRPPVANKTVKNPNAVASNSSHSYGLAMDLKLSVEGYSVTETSTRNMTNFMRYYGSSVTKWMLVNCSKFGWFPYSNEPWHYEYNPEGMADEIIAGAKTFKRSK